MAHFLRPPGQGGQGYDVDSKLAPGSVWRMQVPVSGTRAIALWGGAGLWVRSNNPGVVPNNGFGERQSGDLRILTMTGRTLGTSMLEVGKDQGVWIALQVQVVPAQPVAQTNLLSRAGLNFIAHHEAFRPRLYNDAAGFATIGYGHLVHRSRVGTNRAAEAPYVAGLTQSQALALLNQDVATHVAAVNRAVRVPLTQNQFDALVSFSFNVGAGAMARSGLINLVNHHASAQQIQRSFGQWIHAGGHVVQGLVNRRNDEANLFNNGRY